METHLKAFSLFDNIETCPQVEAHFMLDNEVQICNQRGEKQVIETEINHLDKLGIIEKVLTG